MAETAARQVLLAGASGMVGGYVLEALLQSPEVARVIAVSRRPLAREHPRLANRIVQFDRLEPQLKGVTCQVAVCCLGSTLRSAGSQDAFRQVDVGYVVAFASAARAAQAQRLVVLSSVGADPASKNFYLRTKGEMEAALTGMGFPSLDILQPSLLLGWRSPVRPAELAGQLLMPLVNPLLFGAREVYRAIPGRVVADAMVGAIRAGRRGVQRYTYEGIRALARLRR
jgi:uncharacterized protein YbjT (DUF2867 family)